MAQRLSKVLLVLTISGCQAGQPAAPTVGVPLSGPSTSDAPVVTAPPASRVDLAEPVFSDPTTITNRLFPITAVTQAVQLGTEGDVRLRHEITLLPETKRITWNGQEVETIVSQFVAYADGRLLEVAYDFFAQSDDGSVWYFGEDVFNYEEGEIANRDGTWLAGRDGPPGMIMPADPRAGDVYRPENIPGLVFEEVTVIEVNQTVDGPRGPVPGAIAVREVLMDGVIEDKVFAEGYGEFMAFVASEDERVTVAVATPTDMVPTAGPIELEALITGARGLFAAASAAEPATMQATVDIMTAAWDAITSSGPPELLAAEMEAALGAARLASSAGDLAAARQAAIDTLAAANDLSNQHDAAIPADVGRLEAAALQLVVDADAHDRAALAGGIAIVQAIWERVGYTVDDSAATSFEMALDDLIASAETRSSVEAAVAMLAATRRAASSY